MINITALQRVANISVQLRFGILVASILDVQPPQVAAERPVR